MDRCNGNPAKLRGLGRDRFSAAVRRELPRFGAQRVCHKVADRFFAALTDGRGVTVQRRGALERVGMLIDDWRSAIARLGEVEARMVAVLDGRNRQRPPIHRSRLRDEHPPTCGVPESGQGR